MISIFTVRPGHFHEMSLTCYHPWWHCQHPQFFLADAYCGLSFVIVDLKEHVAEVAAAAAAFAGYYSVAAVVDAVIEPFLSKENKTCLENWTMVHETHNVL